LIADFRDRKSSQMMLRIVRQGFAENVRLARRNDAVAKKHWFRIRVGKAMCLSCECPSLYDFDKILLILKRVILSSCFLL
jgi:hypothetical protein